jgi:Flp pilus assembly protein TadG
MNPPHHQHGRRRFRGDRGAVTGYTVIVTLAVLIFAGLVLDAGLAIATKVDATAAAQSAARAGARELDLAHLRTTGQLRLDPAAAHDAAQDWLDRAGLAGTVNVTGDEVTVTVTTAQDTQLLQLVGITSIPVGTTATATAIPPQ